MGTFYWKSRHKWAAQVTMSDGKRATATCPHDHSGVFRAGLTGGDRARGVRPCQEAKDLLVELERLKAQQAPSNARTLTLGTFLTRWLADVKPNLAPATWRKYESIVRVHLGPRLGTVRLSDLSVGQVRGLLSSTGLDAQSVRHIRATLRRALADAQREGYVNRNVAGLAEAPKLHALERTVLNADQCRTLIEGTREDRMHALYVLAVTTGMREAEMLGLTWDDLHLGSDQRGDRPAQPEHGGVVGGMGESRFVRVEHTLQRVEGQWQLRPPKTDKSRRTIPLAPVAVAALMTHRTRQMEARMAAGAPGKDGLVFTTPSGLPIHGSNLLPEFRAHLKRLGLPKVTIHSLRHSAATTLISIGVPLPVVSDILGHSTIRITADLYRHRVAALEIDAANRMQEALG